MDHKPLTWLRIEAADEARCDTLKRFHVVEPEWKIAKKEMNDAEEALLDGQTAARERFPDSAYDKSTSKALNALTADYEDKLAKYRKLESRKRSLADEIKKLTDNELKMISDAREPGIFAGGEKLGPDGWKKVRLRDITPGPDPEKDLEKQTWTAAGLEENGYHTIGEFLQGRGRLIPAMVDDGEIGATTLEEVDIAVYRYLDKRGLLDRWPKGVDAPSGEQMTILQAPDAAPAEPEPHYDGEKDDEHNGVAGKIGGDDPGPPFAVKLPSASFWHKSKEDIEKASARGVKLMVPWKKLMQQEGGLVFEADDATWAQIDRYLGSNPYEACSKVCAYAMDLKEQHRRGETPAMPDADIGILEEVVELWYSLSDRLGDERVNDFDEWTQFAVTHVIEAGAECLRAMAQWSPTLGAMVAQHRDSAGYDPDCLKGHAELAAKPTPKPTKKKVAKKPAKKTAKKKVTKKAKSK